jgi:hypothetical protein
MLSPECIQRFRDRPDVCGITRQLDLQQSPTSSLATSHGPRGQSDEQQLTASMRRASAHKLGQGIALPLKSRAIQSSGPNAPGPRRLQRPQRRRRSDSNCSLQAYHRESTIVSLLTAFQ